MSTSAVRRAVPLALAVLSACGPPPPEEDDAGPPAALSAVALAKEDNAAWWRGLSQAARNQAILDRAYADLNKYVGLECKEWVQRVVASASRGAATVPLTCPTAAGWYWCPSAYAASQCADLRQAQPGWIVQMNVPLKTGGYGPHTAIVYARSSTGVYWIESNWTNDKKTVHLRFQTFVEFDKWTLINGIRRCSVYLISGG